MSTRRTPEADVVADLVEPGSLEPDRFDCFILTHTLQLVSDPEAALANVWGALRPGGTLLVTVPSLSRVEHAVEQDRWRWTRLGLETLCRRVMRDAELDVIDDGDLVSAIAFLHGISAEETDRALLDAPGGAFTIVACARARKPGGEAPPDQRA